MFKDIIQKINSIVLNVLKLTLKLLSIVLLLLIMYVLMLTVIFLGIKTINIFEVNKIDLVYLITSLIHTLKSTIFFVGLTPIIIIKQFSLIASQYEFMKILFTIKVIIEMIIDFITQILLYLKSIFVNVNKEDILTFNEWINILKYPFTDNLSNKELICYLQMEIYEMIDLNYMQLKGLFINTYSTVIVNIWFTSLLVYVIVSVIYFFNKQLYSYKSVYIIMSLLLLIQLLLSTIILYLNISVKTGFNLTINSQLIVWTPFNLLIDNLSSHFIVTVYMISFGVGTYQYFYIEDSFQKNRFFIQLNWFVISMVMVILSGNWILLLLSWEMLGQTSFFLIGFFKIKLSAMKSSLKAFFYNRISDLVLLLAFVINTKTSSSFNIEISFELKTAYLIVGFFITITALIKSAQFIFFFWLPDSMEAPIPASALIHSATLVSAGFYLILRHINYIEASIVTTNLLFLTSITSMLVFSLIASTQTDIKKLLAYSTISNCAFIYFLIATNNYKFAILYFTTHGLLKSYSFMIGGILIRDQNHYQDTRNWSINSIVYVKLLVLLSITLIMLAALPLSTTYNIKNYINDLNFSQSTNNIIFKLVLIFYSLNSYNYGVKIPLLIFFKKYNFTKNIININHLNNYSSIYLLFFIYFIFIITLFCNYELVHFNQIDLNTNLTVLLVFFFLNIIIIKIDFKKDLNMLITILFVLVTLLSIV